MHSRLAVIRINQMHAPQHQKLGCRTVARVLHSLVLQSPVSPLASTCRFCAHSGEVGGHPKHWDEDKDREPTRPTPDPQSDLRAWVRRVLESAPGKTSHEVFLRDFWTHNEKRYRTVGKSEFYERDAWSWISMLKAALARRVPLRNTVYYAIYSTGVTASLLHVARHESDFEVVKPLIEYYLNNHDALTSVTGFMATALFLTLSFRLNRTADRWWSASSHFGTMSTNVRGLAQTAQLSISNKPMACEIGLLSFAYIRAAEFHLRQVEDASYREAFASLLSAAELDELLAHPHRPYYFAGRITVRLSDAYDAGHVKNVRLVVAMHSILERMLGEMQALDRLAGSPEPWSYQRHMRLTIQLWLAVLPLAIIPSLQMATPVLSSMIGYIVYKLDDVAVEIINPFGYDRSDLPLCLLNDKLQRELLAGMLAYIDWESKRAALVRSEK